MIANQERIYHLGPEIDKGIYVGVIKQSANPELLGSIRFAMSGHGWASPDDIIKAYSEGGFVVYTTDIDGKVKSVYLNMRNHIFVGDSNGVKVKAGNKPVRDAIAHELDFAIRKLDKINHANSIGGMPLHKELADRIKEIIAQH